MKNHRFITYLIALSLLILTACHVASDSQLDYQNPSILPSQTIEDTEEPSTHPDIIEDTEEPSTQPDIIEETTSPSMPTNATRPESSTRPTDPPKLYPDYYGRLHIPEVGVDVALYYGASQKITDRKDSANIFSMSVFDGLYVADHNTQAFKNLHKVLPGTKGYIELQNGDIRYIECIDIFDGYNTGKLITNKNGQTNFQADYLMYTCKKGQNIVICLWKIQ